MGSLRTNHTPSQWTFRSAAVRGATRGWEELTEYVRLKGGLYEQPSAILAEVVGTQLGYRKKGGRIQGTPSTDTYSSTIQKPKACLSDGDFKAHITLS